MDPEVPDLTQIFRDELEERSSRLVAGARGLAEGTLAHSSVPDLIRDAHTIKGSAGLLGHDLIREAATRLEVLWRNVGEGDIPEQDTIVAMEAMAGRMVSALDSGDQSELSDLIGRLDSSMSVSATGPELVPIRHPEPGSLGGLLTSVSESLLGGATRVDTGDLYRLINRVVEVALDAEALADLSTVSIEGADPDKFRRAWRSQLEKLSRSIADIQDQAVALANVSFFDAVATFPQFVRYLGRRLGKDVRIEITGHDLLFDRQISDLIREPLRHLLVNAVDHGIEPPERRVAAGKPATGTIRISARSVDDGMEVVVVDDGAGIDWERVAEVARDRAMPMSGELTPLLFQPGFTTVDVATDFSGEGEGLPLAAEAVERVNGAIQIDSEPGRGTTVRMLLPKSMVLQNVVVIAAGDQFWGLPEASVEAAIPMSRVEISSTNGGRQVTFESSAVPVVSLAEAVGETEPMEETELLVIGTRSGLVAVTVGELVDRRRVAVKNLGPILEGSGHITGAALLGGGEVLVVLDPNFLGTVARQRPHLAGAERPRILVVDDSAGVRRLLSATLTGAGFDVEVASGAREAMTAMASNGFDAMVVDYSMPRSNGVELIRALRAADVRVPIVMVSGVATQEEKDAAWQVGVDAYLDKYDLRHGVLTKTLWRLLGREETGRLTGSA